MTDDTSGPDRAEETTERVHHLLVTAAEPRRQPHPPGPEFVRRARRGLRWRRTALAAAVVVVGTATAPVALRGLRGADEAPPAASAGCLRQSAASIVARDELAFAPVYGTILPGRIAPVEDTGGTVGSAFRFSIDGTLSASRTVPASGTVTVWYPDAAVLMPEPGRYLLLLAPAERRRTNGDGLYFFAPEAAHVRPLTADGRIRLECGTATPDQLRAAVAGAS